MTMTTEHVIGWGAVAVAVAAAVVVALTAARRRAGSYLLVTGGLLAGLVLLMRPTADRPPPSGDTADRVVYVGWTHRPLLVELARRFDKTNAVVVVSPQSHAFARTFFSRARVEPMAGEAPDGVTAARAAADLRDRLPRLAPGTRVCLVAPRDTAPDAARGLFAELARGTPWVREAVETLPPSRFGLAFPAVLADAPLLVSPYEPRVGVQVIARGLGTDGEYEITLTALGPKQGEEHQGDGSLAESRIGVGSDGGLAEGVASIRPAAEQAAYAGKLAAPREGKTITWDAAVGNRYGEVVAFHRATTTARIQPIGVLVPKGREGEESAFEILLQDLQLEYQRVVLDLSAGADVPAQARAAERWRVLVCDRRFDATEAAKLATVLKAAAVRPKFLFVGNDSDYAALPGGWATLLTAPLSPGPCRTVVIGSDTSGSMFDSCGVGSKKKWEMAAELATELADGLEKRRWNVLVQPLVGPSGGTTLNSRADGPPATVGNYADPKASPPWELHDFLLAVHRLAAAGNPISDAVFTFDPDDVHSDATLPGESRKAAEELKTKHGVNLWLVAAGRKTNASELGDVVQAGVKTSLETHGYDPEKLKAAVKGVVYEQMFPRLQVEAGDAGIGLTKGGWERLAAYVQAHRQHLRLLNGLASFQLKAEVAKPDEVSLYLKHWADPKRVAPLLARTPLTLGGGQTADALHLGLDLTAERAKIPSGTSAYRNALAGLLVQIVGALADEFQEPNILWTADGSGGLRFYPADHSPFRITPKADRDPVSLRGVGLGVRAVDGFGAGRTDARPDTRRLELPALHPDHLDRTMPTLFKFVVEDERPEVGALTLHVPLRAAPPSPLPAGEDLLGLSTPAVPPPSVAAPWDTLPAWAVPLAVIGCWAAVAVALRKWL